MGRFCVILAVLNPKPTQTRRVLPEDYQARLAQKLGESFADCWSELVEKVLPNLADEQIRLIARILVGLESQQCRLLVHLARPETYTVQEVARWFAQREGKPFPDNNGHAIKEVEARLGQVVSKIRRCLDEFFAKDIEGVGSPIRMDIPKARVSGKYGVTWEPKASSSLQHPQVRSYPVGTEKHFTAITELLRLKFHQDFEHSVCHDQETFLEAQRECRTSNLATARLGSGAPLASIQAIVDDEVTGIPRLKLGIDQYREDGKAIAAAFSELIDYSQTHPICVDSQSIEVAAFAVLLSLSCKYDLRIKLSMDSPSGHPQVLALGEWSRTNRSDNPPDFVITADAAYFFAARDEALNYVWLFPVHMERQCLFRRVDGTAQARPRLFIYEGSSIEQQWRFWSRGIIVDNPAKFSSMDKNVTADMVRTLMAAATPCTIPNLGRFMDAAKNMSAGDLVFAWEPLASRFARDYPFEQVGPDHWNYMSMYCHKRWRTGKKMTRLKDMFKHLFLLEWRCAKFDQKTARSYVDDNDGIFKAFALGTGIDDWGSFHRRGE